MGSMEQRIELKALDGEPLVGYLFENHEPNGAVLICSATAVRQRFYFPFARWLCAQGFNCLTLDYRGIGESLNARSARASTARKQDWGQLDMPGALNYLEQSFPNLDKHLVGHSAGDVLVGLMPNFGLLKSVVGIGCTTGYVHEISLPYRLVAGALLHVYFPAAIKVFGYLPAKRLGWGEDLPQGVASQWAHWCTNPGYVKNSFGREIAHHFYDRLVLPILILNAADDPIATEPNVNALLELFPNAATQVRLLKPQEHGLLGVGHMGFFYPQNRALWEHVLPGIQK